MTFMKLHSGFLLLQHCVNYFIATFISLIISEMLLVVSYQMSFVLDSKCLDGKKGTVALMYVITRQCEVITHYVMGDYTFICIEGLSVVVLKLNGRDNIVNVKQDRSAKLITTLGLFFTLRSLHILSHKSLQAQAYEELSLSFF